MMYPAEYLCLASLQEYHGEAFWESAWPLPALYAAFLVFCMPKEIGIILMNRMACRDPAGDDAFQRYRHGVGSVGRARL